MKKLFTIVALIVGLAAPALAQEFPTKPVRLIHGYGSGGFGGILAHMFADELGKQLKQPVVVEDRPGVGNSIAARAAMAAPADGYTLHLGWINPHPLVQNSGVDLAKEMEPIAFVSSTPYVFVTTATKPLKSVAEVIAYAKANPGQLDFGSQGNSAYIQLMMALFANRAGITYRNIPFKSSGEIQTAIYRGDVQISLFTLPTSGPVTSGGKAVPVMIGAPARSALLPNVPTPAELGLGDINAESAQGLFAPKGTPPEVIQKLSAAAMAVLREPAYREAMRSKTGVAAPEPMTPEQTRARFAATIKDLEEAVKLANYKAQ